MVDFVAYHDRTSADHQAHFDDLFPKGFRMTSLSVYGARGDERYAAVWVKRPGPDWSAVHGVNGAGYQAAFDNAVALGFKPVLLAASGSANDPVFAGTFVQGPGPVPLTTAGLRSRERTTPTPSNRKDEAGPRRAPERHPVVRLFLARTRARYAP